MKKMCPNTFPIVCRTFSYVARITSTRETLGISISKPNIAILIMYLDPGYDKSLRNGWEAFFPQYMTKFYLLTYVRVGF